MKSITIVLMVITLLSKMLGFLRDLIMSYFYGISNVTEAVVIAQTVPFSMLSVLAIGISNGYIPFYNSIEKEKGTKKANAFTSNLANLTFIVSIAYIVLGLIFTRPIVQLFASGFSGERLELAVMFTRISMCTVFAIALRFIYQGYLHVHSQFIVPSLEGIIMNVVLIASIFVSAKTNIYVLAVGMALSTVLQYVLYIPAIRKTGYRHSWEIHWKDKDTIRMMQMAMPIIFGTAVNQINTLVDRTLSSQIAIGGVAILAYSNRLNEFVNGIVIIAIGTVVYPAMSRLAVEKNMDIFKQVMRESLSLLMVFVIPSIVGIMIFAKPLASFIFVRGAFTENNAIALSGPLFFYAANLFGIAIRDIFVKAFYALKDTKTPVVVSMIMVIMNTIISFLASRWMGLSGLALGTTTASIIGGFMMLWQLRKKIGSIKLHKIFRNCFKISTASVVMAVTGFFLYRYLLSRVSDTKALLVAIVAAAFVYLLSISLMRAEEISTLARYFHQKTSH